MLLVHPDRESLASYGDSPHWRKLVCKRLESVVINVAVFHNGIWMLIRFAKLRLKLCLPEFVSVHLHPASYFMVCYDGRLMSQLQMSANEAVVG